MQQDKSVGQRILLLRVNRGYSRETLAEFAGISAKFLYEIETNKKGFSAYTLQRIAGALEVSLDYIMTGQGAREHDEEIYDTICRFKPNTLQAVEQLLQAAYELACSE